MQIRSVSCVARVVPTLCPGLWVLWVAPRPAAHRSGSCRQSPCLIESLPESSKQNQHNSTFQAAGTGLELEVAGLISVLQKTVILNLRVCHRSLHIPGKPLKRCRKTWHPHLAAPHPPQSPSSTPYCNRHCRRHPDQ